MYRDIRFRRKTVTFKEFIQIIFSIFILLNNLYDYPMRNYGIVFVIAALIFGSGSVMGQEKGTCVTDLILSSYSSKAFNSTPVTDDQIEMVLRSGIKAPSARNSQTWKFTVVKDHTLATEVIRDALPGNVVVVISGPEEVQQGFNPDIDCSLAAAYMYLAAQSLGLGSHLYTGPVGDLNENLREKLEIPDGYKTIIILKMGNMDNQVDGVSSASPRNDLKEFVNYK